MSNTFKNLILSVFCLTVKTCVHVCSIHKHVYTMYFNLCIVGKSQLASCFIRLMRNVGTHAHAHTGEVA